MPAALIIGCAGQDGTYLYHLLERKHYDVLGFDIGRVEGTFNWTNGPVDFCDPQAVSVLFEALQFDEVYFLAAFHHSSEDAPIGMWDLVDRSIRVNTLALNNVLACLLTTRGRTRLFYAASSRIFGDPEHDPQDENTAIAPNEPYGFSKAAGLQLCRYYRRAGGVFAAAGIFYNHESPLRTKGFVSQKIVSAAVRISKGLQDRLMVGDLGSAVDWGYAPDYTCAAWRMLQLDTPDDFVIGTGVLHSVKDFVRVAFGCLRLDWEKFVMEDPALLKGAGSKARMRANASRLMERTGWRPTVSFEQMIEIMIESELYGSSTANSNLYSDLQ